MRDAVAIVESASDIAQLAREIAKEHVALQDCDRHLDASERKSEGLREQQRRHRVAIGQMLVEAKRSIKHGGWLPYLEKLGIEDRRAREWMQLAGWVESKSAASGNVADLDARKSSLPAVSWDAPTLADAGIDKRPRKSERAASPAIVGADDEPAPMPRATDLDRALVGIHKTMIGYAKTWPRRSRIELAKTLRSLASEIEGMIDAAEQAMGIAEENG